MLLAFDNLAYARSMILYFWTFKNYYKEIVDKHRLKNI